jgi:hypothetical protein
VDNAGHPKAAKGWRRMSEVSARKRHIRFGLSVPNAGDATQLVDLAVTAEGAGWDGFFLWDHLQLDALRRPPMHDRPSPQALARLIRALNPSPGYDIVATMTADTPAAELAAAGATWAMLATLRHPPILEQRQSSAPMLRVCSALRRASSTTSSENIWLYLCCASTGFVRCSLDLSAAIVRITVSS